jgi:hypothetical protein
MDIHTAFSLYATLGFAIGFIVGTVIGQFISLGLRRKSK